MSSRRSNEVIVYVLTNRLLGDFDKKMNSKVVWYGISAGHFLVHAVTIKN